MKKSQQAAEHGNPYPIWATCLGFEQMVVLVADQCCLTRCNAKDIMSSLVPIDWKSSSFIQTSTQKAKSRASWGIQYCVIVSIRSRKARHWQEHIQLPRLVPYSRVLEQIVIKIQDFNHPTTEQTFLQNEILQRYFELVAVSIGIVSGKNLCHFGRFLDQNIIVDINGLRYVALLENKHLKWTASQVCLFCFVFIRLNFKL